MRGRKSMFNNKLKKVAMQETEEAVKIYDIAFENMIKKSRSFMMTNG